MNIRPATIEDVRSLWGIELPMSLRAYAAEHDGELLGVAGIAYFPGRLVAFADMQDSAQRYPLTIMRVARKVQALLREAIAPVYCEADCGYPNSRAFLEHVGFKNVSGRVYVWQN